MTGQIIRQRTKPEAPVDGLIWIDTGTARAYEYSAGLAAFVRLTPAQLAARFGGTLLSVDELLAAVRDRGAVLRVLHGELEIHGAGALTDELVAEIRAHEAELIARLPDETARPRRFHRPNWSGDWWNGPGYDQF